MKSVALVLGLMTLTYAGPASAYLGPGMGIGAFGVVLGLIGAVLLAIFAVVWYPLKRLFGRKKQSPRVSAEADRTADKDSA